MSVYTHDKFEVRNLMTSEIDVLAEPVVSKNDNCQRLADELVTINELEVFQTIHECNDVFGYKKTNSYIILTLTRAIVVSYSALSESAYNNNLKAFEDSLAALKISEPTNFRDGFELITGINKVYKEKVEIESLNDEIDLDIESASSVSGFSFDEDGKRITMRVDEQKKTHGAVLLSAGRILQGPYVVLVDNKPADDYIVMTDADTGIASVYVGYGPGVHNVEISGVAVVPEFPFGIVGILAVVLSAAVIYQRRFAKK